MKKVLFLALIAITIVSCRSNTNHKYKKSSVGNPYEMFVVMPKLMWSGNPGSIIRNSLAEGVVMINDDEPAFDLMQVKSETVRGLSQQHRNILLTRIGDKYKTPRVVSIEDQHSEPQLIVVVEAPNQVELEKLLASKIDSIKIIFENEEMDRFVKKVRTKGSVAVQDSITKLFGFQMSIPVGAKIRDVNSAKNFIWSSYEMPEASQGTAVYTYPYTGDELNAQNIQRKRDEFVSLIPGPSKGSHMTTSDAFELMVTPMNINGNLWYEAKGFWRVENDFMGGTFTSYSTVDKVNNRVIVIDNYVFSPNPQKGQRNYIKQLESLVRTARF